MEHVISKIEDYLLTCPVCLEPAFSEGSDYQSLPCEHQLCDVCIKKWQQNGKITCPVCQKQFRATKFPTLLPTKQLSELIASFQEELKLIDEHQSFTVGEAQQSKQEDRSTLMFSMIKQYSLCQHYPEVNELIITNKTKVYIPSTTTAIRKLDFSARRKWTQFGHQDSIYLAAMVYNNQLLYVYNISTHYLEVYKDEKPVTKWKLEFPELNYEGQCHTITDLSLQPFPDGVLVSLSVKLCDGSRKDAFKIFQPGKKDIIEVKPQYLRSTSMKQDHLICRFLHRNRVLCIHRDSLWFVDRRDKHLMELSFEFAKHVPSKHRVIIIKEPIRHFKIPNFKMGCGFNHKLFYTACNSDHIYQLDLSQLPPLSNYRIRNNRVLYTQPTMLEPAALLQLPNITHITALGASESGYLVTADDQRVIQLYQQSDLQATEGEDVIANDVESGPGCLAQCWEVMKYVLMTLISAFLLPHQTVCILLQYLFLPVEIFLSFMIVYFWPVFVGYYFFGYTEPYEKLIRNILKPLEYLQSYFETY